MGRQQTSGEIKRNCIEKLSWQTADRDDSKVAKAINQGEEVDAVYGLDEAGLLDEFFHFLQLIGVLSLIEGMQLPGVQRVVVPMVQFVLLYMLKVLFGVESMNALPQLLLSPSGEG